MVLCTGTKFCENISKGFRVMGWTHMMGHDRLMYIHPNRGMDSRTDGWILIILTQNPAIFVVWHKNQKNMEMFRHHKI